MRRSSSRLFAVGAATSSIALGASLAATVLGLWSHLFDFFILQTAATSFMLGLVAMAAGRRGSGNAGVWVTSGAGLLMALECAGVVAGGAILRDSPEILAALSASELASTDIPASAAVAFWIQKTWLASLGGFLTLGLLLFPDGRLPSPRWRVVAGLSVLGLTLFTVGSLIAEAPGSDTVWNTFDTHIVLRVMIGVGAPLVAVSILASVVSLMVRHRRAGPEHRHQVRWMLFGAGTFALALVASFTVGAIAFGIDAQQTQTLASYATMVGLPFLVASYGVGIVRYRLYEIDVVINRSIVFGLLAAFITSVYVAIVVGLGSLFDSRSNLVLAVAATAVIAVVFEPVRQLVQRWANRLVYGSRATPYEVLSSLNVPQESVDDLVAGSAAILARGVGAEAVVIRGSGPETGRAVSAWPPSAADLEVDWDLEVPLMHEGQQVGSVGVAKKRGEQLSAQDRRLVAEFAGQTSLLLANRLLNRRLEARLDELRVSRRRLVAAQDEARRRLERDLHDGAQQELVALKVKLGLARHVARSEHADEAETMLETVVAEADEAVDALRRLARGVYPPLLEAEGLQAAVTAHIRSLPVPTELHADGIVRHSQEIESTVYFCLLEALDNVTRHSDATRAEIHLADTGTELVFSVTDDGRGFDGLRGDGLIGMDDRLDTLGGRLEVSTGTDEGTTIRGSVPLQVAAVS